MSVDGDIDCNPLFASRLAPTGIVQFLTDRQMACRYKPGDNASFNFTLVDRPAHPHIGATDA
ncbi:hypothetical protein BR1R3_01150 [Pseudomonas atacamensis]|nr:hypothetical protein BR1R3_01150 [Pseudomonas atacamensis]